MISWKKNLACLWISQFFVLGGFAALIPFIPLIFEDGLHVTNKQELALYISMFNFWGTVGYAFFCPIWGLLSDKVGVKIMLLRGTFLTGLIFPLMAYTANPWILIFLRFLTSACAGTTPAAQIMVARTVPVERQGFAQGILNSAYWSGMVFGNVAGGVIISRFGYQAGFWMCGIMYFLAGFFILFTQDAQTVPAPEKIQALPSTSIRAKLCNLISAFPSSVWALIGLFLLVGTICYYDTPYLAIKIKNIIGAGAAVQWTGIVSAVVCGGSIIAGVVSGYLADKVKAGWLVTAYLLLSAVALVVEGYTGNLIVFTITQTVMFAAVGGIQPVLQKRLSLTVPAEKRGTAFGFSTTMNACGGLLAAVISGAVFSRLSVDWIYYSCAIIAIGSWPLMLMFIPKTERKKEIC